MRSFSMLSMACVAMLMLSATADAGDIRFQRLGKTITRFRSDQYGNGTIYNYGSTGRIQFDDDGQDAFSRAQRAQRYSGYGVYGGYGGFDNGPALEFPAQPQFGAPGIRYQYGANGQIDPYASGIIRRPQPHPFRLGFVN